MKRFDLTRREFLHKSAVGASALAMGAAGRARAAEKKDEVAIGFIGVGGRGSTLLRKIMRTEGVRVVAVCDLKTDRLAKAQEAAAKFKPKGYTDLNEMLDKEKLDGVIVATEVGNHAKAAIPVLERGLNCFCEKPLETTVERMDALIKAARKSKGIVQVGFQRHYNDGYVKAVEKIHSGDLGKVAFMQGQWSWTWQVGGHWACDMDLGGGELVEQAGHHMDVMAWVMKYQHPIECVAMANVCRDLPEDAKPTSEDHAAVTFRFPGNAIFSYSHLFFCPQPFEAEKMLVYGRGWGIDLVKSELYTPPPDNKVVNLGEDSGKDWDKGTNEEMDAFVENIRNGGKEKPRSNIETARIATLMCFMGRKAFRDVKSNKFESQIVKWEDLGTTTDQ